MAEQNNNPWKGLDSYNYSDNIIFYGRRNETNALVETIVNNRFTILYGPSGVGKSSLLNAGIRPILAEGNYFVVDVSMRLLDLKSEQPISSQILKRVRQCAEEKDIDITPLSKSEDNNLFADSLWYFFHTNEFWSPKNEFLTPIVIIDQFEDIFKEEIKELSPNTFFSNLDELSNVVPPLSVRKKIQDIESFRYNQSADFRFVFSLREDYLPRLDDYVYSLNIPELRKSRYSITLMDTNQAKEVILGPANGIVSENVADKIIDILSKQSTQNRITKKIEPFILSLFMYRVYIEMRKRELSFISEDLINKIGSDVVNDFYLESMKKVSSKAMKHLENVLLTQKGHRDSISYDKLMNSEKVTDKELSILLEARIIKKNTVNNVERLEFTHDILSQYAQLNKEKRDQNNKSQIIIGYLGSFLTLFISIFAGWIMSRFLTYLSIPILIIAAIICAYAILNIKFSTKKSTLIFWGKCGILGVLIDLTQIIPSIGYFLYFAICIISFYLLKRYTDSALIKTTPAAKYHAFAFIWLYAFVIIPMLCFGYNIFCGMNYSRSTSFSKNTFYVKNGHGQYGLRNRYSILIKPQYDESLQIVGNEYIAKSNGKYGLLDSCLLVKMPIEYDNYIISENKPYFYLAGKEVAGNGLQIGWDESINSKQKNILRTIVSNMVPIKGGNFKMGTNSRLIKNKISDFVPTNGEDFVHDVSLSDFYLNKFEVTLEEWIEIMGYDPRKRPARCKSDSVDNMKLPVYKVSYDACQTFIDKISLLTGLPFSLPTEAQWEYAAKGGENHDEYLFAGSDSEFDVGWISRNSNNILHQVGDSSKKPNSLGLFDMTGNVLEFCKDSFSQTFYKESNGQKNPCCKNGEIFKSKKVIVQRGGSYESIQAQNLIVSRRIKAYANREYRSSGFRLAINL